MDSHVSRPISGRRAFLRAALPGGALLCLGGPCLLAAPQAEEKAKPAGQKHKFLEDARMSMGDVFRMAYAQPIPVWRELQKEIGSEEFIALLKRTIDQVVKQQMAEEVKRLGKNDFAAFTQDMRQLNPFMQNAVTFRIVEDTPQAFEIKVTECLWAKTYREANAGDLGYILTCHGDFAAAREFNPKIRMIRTKTLMQGDEFCNHRYVVEG